MKYIFIAAAFCIKPSGMENNALVTVMDAVAEAGGVCRHTAYMNICKSYKNMQNTQNLHERKF